ncbi:M23 family metallopeptidase [Microbacterium koreense]|uniref:M23 family metallopeptidase n=1 Tax=Microbacterium koreense TaxID=323761 RepID=A0ABW2ZQ06_9MICO
MQFDSTPTEPARSGRASTTPGSAPTDAAPLTRAEVRRRAAAALAAAAAAVEHNTVTGPVEAVVADVVPVDEAIPAPAPLTRRSARAARSVAAEPVLAPAEPFELLEPAVQDESGDELPAQHPDVLVEAPEAPDVPPTDFAPTHDEFVRAARAFSFTGETAVVPDDDTTEPAPARDEAPDDESRDLGEEVASHAVRRGRRARPGIPFQRVAATSFSLGVMGVIGLLTVGMTTPVEAVVASSAPEGTMSVLAPLDAGSDVEPVTEDEEIQAYVAPATTENADIEKTESYSTATMAELAYESGITNVSNFFVNDPNSAIQWPFAVGVPISYGFGMRSGAMHQGVDFTPGSGAPIQAIADGTVRVATNSGGAYGVHVIIDHEVDGQLVSSHYAHMIYDSIEVVPGQTVTAGTVLGLTGNTGRSFGAHLHFEILMNGTTPIDPIPWLRQYAGG